MKILKLFFPIIAIMTVWQCEVYAIPDSPVTIMLNPEGNEKEIPDKGMRSPSLSSTCIIDFSSLEIIFSEAYAVISYELCDEDGTTIVALYDNDYEMVMYLANLSGCYQLRLVTDTGVYVGYLYL